MCGIVGVLSSEGFKGSVSRKKAFIQSLYTDALRGFDSTGLLLAGGKPKMEVAHYKRALPAADFLTTKRAQKLLSDMDDFSFVIGHNRYATKGGINDNTAHPFDFDNVIGVHNGTLKSTHGLPGHLTHDVDSEVLYNAFSQDGHTPIIPKLDGAFALAWYNKAEKELHLIRNEDRPLFIAGVKGEDTIFLASEKEMLEWILFRNGITTDFIQDIGVGKLLTFNTEKVKEFKEEVIPLKKKEVYGGDYWNRAATGNGKKNVVPYVGPLAKIGLKIGDKVDFIIEEFKPYANSQAAKSTGSVYGYITDNPKVQVVSYQQKEEAFLGEEGAECEGIVKSTFLGPGGDHIVILEKEILWYAEDPLEGDTSFTGPNGEAITKSEWDSLTKHGCCMCQGNILDEDSGRVGWSADKQPYCPECIETLGMEGCIPTKVLN